MRRYFALLLLLAICSACTNPKPDTLVESGYEQAEELRSMLAEP
jgi:hypothetical protein